MTLTQSHICRAVARIELDGFLGARNTRLWLTPQHKGLPQLPDRPRVVPIKGYRGLQFPRAPRPTGLRCAAAGP